MTFEPVHIEHFANASTEPATLHDIVRVLPGGTIVKATMLGPTYLNRNARLGPDITIGKYCSLNVDTIIARGTVGAFCAFGARNTINPFNHPTEWLSIHEFQFRSDSYDWIKEYTDFERLSRTPDMFSPVTIGNDVWTGHNVNVMAGVNVGDGAIIGAGSIVTKDVPPYAIVAGVPATVKSYRFSDAVIARLLKAKWWELELSDLSGLPFRDVEGCLDRIEEIRARKRGAIG